MSQTQTLEESQHEGQKISISTWKRLFRFALAYPRLVAGVAGLSFLVGLADIAFPLVTKYLIDAIEGWDPESGLARPALWPYALAYGVIGAVLCGSVFSFIRVVGRLKTKVNADIREQGFANLQNLSFAYYDKRATGWLMSRMTSDCERLARIMAWGTLDVLWASTFLIGISVVLLVLHWQLGLLVLTVVPLLAWASRFFQKRLLKASRKIRKINSTMTADFNESIMGVLTTKSFNQQEPNGTGFGRLADDMYTASLRNAVLSALYLPTILTIGSLATAIVLIQGGWTVSAMGMSLGTWVAFLSYTRLMFEPLQELAMIFSDMQMAQAAGERIVELLSEEPTIVDSEEVQARQKEQAERAKDGQTKPGTADDGYPESVGPITFENVSFSYGGGQGGSKKVLDGINLSVEPGSTIALVGSTGGGKTTLISLLCRFYEPTEGRICIGGIDQKSRSLRWLQSIFGIVLQDSFLFNGSVLENIRYGRLDATDEEVFESARIVGAEAFIQRLEGGYGFDVGEGGARLSQGERQLVSFARALLRNPAVLVMDEATSNIDTETERQIQVGLERVLQDRTSFIIAHRLSTIERADRILVIEKGQIAEQGNHAELMRLQGRYFELHQHQGLVATGKSAADWKAE